MALIKCPDCAASVSTSASGCPICGSRHGRPFLSFCWLVVLVASVISLIGVLIATFSRDMSAIQQAAAAATAIGLVAAPYCFARAVEKLS